MKSLLSVVFAALSGTMLLGWTVASAVDCTHDAVPCDFDMGGGQCCWTVTSLPHVVEHEYDGQVPDWIPSPSQDYCGTVFAPYLGSPCTSPTATYCGDPASANCI